MCNLYSITKAQDAIGEIFRVKRDRTDNLPSMPGVFPDYMAPVVRSREDERTPRDALRLPIAAEREWAARHERA